MDSRRNYKRFAAENHDKRMNAFVTIFQRNFTFEDHVLV